MNPARGVGRPGWWLRSGWCRWHRRNWRNWRGRRHRHDHGGWRSRRRSDCGRGRRWGGLRREVGNELHRQNDPWRVEFDGLDFTPSAQPGFPNRDNAHRADAEKRFLQGGSQRGRLEEFQTVDGYSTPRGPGSAADRGVQSGGVALDFRSDPVAAPRAGQKQIAQQQRHRRQCQQQRDGPSPVAEAPAFPASRGRGVHGYFFSAGLGAGFAAGFAGAGVSFAWPALPSGKRTTTLLSSNRVPSVDSSWAR